MSLPIVDPDKLLEIMGHDSGLIRECFQDFLQSEQEMLDDIRQALDRSGAEALVFAAHKLKGSLGCLAAAPAVEAAEALERAGRSKTMEQGYELLEELEFQCSRLRAFIRTFRP
ncbi:MAG: Hpt domain-containing protein [Desulfobacterales bacterium]|nr:Hpt domain-containing protein [Desulfobacterales bacterium]